MYMQPFPAAQVLFASDSFEREHLSRSRYVNTLSKIPCIYDTLCHEELSALTLFIWRLGLKTEANGSQTFGEEFRLRGKLFRKTLQVCVIMVRGVQSIYISTPYINVHIQTCVIPRPSPEILPQVNFLPTLNKRHDGDIQHHKTVKGFTYLIGSTTANRQTKCRINHFQGIIARLTQKRKTRH